MKKVQFILLSIMTAASLFATENWYDDYYQFRTPVEVNVPKPGNYKLQINPGQITEFINRDLHFKFSENYFNFAGLKLVEVNKNGRQKLIKSGYVLKMGKELVQNGSFSQLNKKGLPLAWAWPNVSGFFIKKMNSAKNYLSVKYEKTDCNSVSQRIKVKKYTWYRLAYRARGYREITPLYSSKSSPPGTYQHIKTAFWDKALLDGKKWYKKIIYFYTGNMNDWKTPFALIRIIRHTGDFADFSLKECSTEFTADFVQTGKNKYFLYYAPSEGICSVVPAKIRSRLPRKSLHVKIAGSAQSQENKTSGILAENAWGAFWQTPTTKKILKTAKPPLNRVKSISLTCARNEGEAAQLVFSPQKTGVLKSIKVLLTDPEGRKFPAKNIEIRQAEYVQIVKASAYAHGRFIFPQRFEFKGYLPDPLPKFTSVNFSPDTGNLLLWLDFKVPANAHSGLYKGKVTLETSLGDFSIPLTLKVWDFTLPNVKNCRTALAFNQYANQFLFPYHKITSKADKYRISRKYIAEMGKYGMTVKIPTTAGTYLPEYAYAKRSDPEVLKKMYTSELSWAFDKLHLNSAIIGHYAGNSRKNLEKSIKNLKKNRQVLSSIAKTLQKHGWLSRAYIAMDEPRFETYDLVKKLFDGLRDTPDTANIKAMTMVYNSHAYQLASDLFDIFAIYDGEISYLSPSGIKMLRKRGIEPWAYYTRATALWIDTPGINNRLWAPKVWNNNAKGIFVWGINQWWSRGWVKLENPWKNPHCPWGNGALAFFYPPDRKGKNLEKKTFKVVPSLRLLLYRDGIEDFDYAVILEKLITQAKKRGVETSQAELALNMMRKQFFSPVNWNLSEVHWQKARKQVAFEIVELQGKVKNESTKRR